MLPRLLLIFFYFIFGISQDIFTGILDNYKYYPDTQIYWGGGKVLFGWIFGPELYEHTSLL